MKTLYGPQYDVDGLKRKAIHILTIHYLTKEARLLGSVLDTLTDRQQVIAAIRKAGIHVWE